MNRIQCNGVNVIEDWSQYCLLLFRITKYCKVRYKLFKRHFNIDPLCFTRNQIVKLCCGFSDVSFNTFRTCI